MFEVKNGGFETSVGPRVRNTDFTCTSTPAPEAGVWRHDDESPRSANPRRSFFSSVLLLKVGKRQKHMSTLLRSRPKLHFPSTCSLFLFLFPVATMHCYLFPLYPYKNTFHLFVLTNQDAHAYPGIRTINPSRPLSTALSASAPASRVVYEQNYPIHTHTRFQFQSRTGPADGVRACAASSKQSPRERRARPYRTDDRRNCPAGCRGMWARTKVPGSARWWDAPEKVQFVMGLDRKGETRSAVFNIALLPSHTREQRQSASRYRGGVRGGGGGGSIRRCSRGGRRRRRLCRTRRWTRRRRHLRRALARELSGISRRPKRRSQSRRPGRRRLSGCDRG